MDGLNINGFDKARKARIKCETISDGQFLEEVVVTVNASNGPITGIFPLSSVDKTHRTVTVFIVSEKGDRYLVDLPTYTFTTGSKAWFPKEAVLF